MNVNLNLKFDVTRRDRRVAAMEGRGRLVPIPGERPEGPSWTAGQRGGNLGNGQWLLLLLTKCTVVGKAVDLDTVADNHQVGGHLSAFVRLYTDALSVLVERQLRQVAHPLTCQGRSVTRRLAEGGQGWGLSQG